MRLVRDDVRCLPYLIPSRRVLCTNPCTSQDSDLRASGYSKRAGAHNFPSWSSVTVGPPIGERAKSPGPGGAFHRANDLDAMGLVCWASLGVMARA
jgi:hypothetical protein